MHGRFKYLSKAILGEFPYFTDNIFCPLTPQTHRALHDEGLRAMSAPLATEFVEETPRQGRALLSSTVLESDDEISASEEEERLVGEPPGH